MRTHKKLLALAIILMTIGFRVAIGHADTLVNRGLPTANLNDQFGYASNTSFGYKYPLLAGDTFSIGNSGETYNLSTISVWVVGEPSIPTSLFGGYTADPGGIKQISSSVLSDTVVIYTGGTKYYDGTYDIHKVDFQVNLPISGGKGYYFFVNGSPDDSGYTPFVHGSNALLSGSPQDGSDNVFYVYDPSTGSIFLENAATGSWDKSADLNLLVLGTKVPEPPVVLLVGFGLSGLAVSRKLRKA